MLSVECSPSHSASASSCLSLGTQEPGGSGGGQGERIPGDLLDSDAFPWRVSCPRLKTGLIASGSQAEYLQVALLCSLLQ